MVLLMMVLRRMVLLRMVLLRMVLLRMVLLRMVLLRIDARSSEFANLLSSQLRLISKRLHVVSSTPILKMMGSMWQRRSILTLLLPTI
jgi:hypothetical protein